MKPINGGGPASVNENNLEARLNADFIKDQLNMLPSTTINRAMSNSRRSPDFNALQKSEEKVYREISPDL